MTWEDEVGEWKGRAQGGEASRGGSLWALWTAIEGREKEGKGSQKAIFLWHNLPMEARVANATFPSFPRPAIAST